MELVKALLRAGADVAARGGQESWTPVHLAAKLGSVKVLKLLV